MIVASGLIAGACRPNSVSNAGPTTASATDHFDAPALYASVKRMLEGLDRGGPISERPSGFDECHEDQEDGRILRHGYACSAASVPNEEARYVAIRAAAAECFAHREPGSAP